MAETSANGNKRVDASSQITTARRTPVRNERNPFSAPNCLMECAPAFAADQDALSQVLAPSDPLGADSESLGPVAARISVEFRYPRRVSGGSRVPSRIL